MAGDAREWLETDGLGGFATGPVSGPRARRYHGLLVTATTPPVGRMMLVSGLDVTVETPAGRFLLSAQRYASGDGGSTTKGDDGSHLETFAHEPWPSWTFRLPDGTRLAHELFMRAGAPQVWMSWRLLSSAGAEARLTVRPFLAGRDFHALMHENDAFSFRAEGSGAHVRFQPYAGVPAMAIASNGTYTREPLWYRRFLYDEERRRGLDCEEDLASPGTWCFELADREAVLVLGAAPGAAASAAPGAAASAEPGAAASAYAALDAGGAHAALEAGRANAALEAARGSERARRAALGSARDRAADQYLVARGAGSSIIAGYPWFGDWGRDTFIALRGLLLARGRIGEALQILSVWAGLVSEGMLPNYFPDATGAPAYNTVDASLWYVIAVCEAVSAAPTLAERGRRGLVEAVEAILTGHAAGTRHGIRATDDGLLAAGEPGLQLTWMDACVDGHVVTPRIGKPVEVQALWLNALAGAAALGAPSAPRWRELSDRGRASFEARFWDEARGCLHDVVDCDHVAGTVDARMRPNQIFAVGGLPLTLLPRARAARVVEVVERTLLTPVGLRTLAPGEPGYRGRYEGDVAERDGAYHQGTVWPWLLGPFVEAWVRVRGATPEAVEAARARFLDPLARQREVTGLGHVPELADGDEPHEARGCPFQAWSLGELLRLDRHVLAPGAAATPARRGEPA